MQEKTFEWQYRDEKILLRTKPHFFHIFIEKLPIFSVYFWLFILFLIIWIFYQIFFIIIWIIFLAIFFLYFSNIYKNTYYTFTSRRCIFFIKKTIIKRKYNEIHMVDLRTAVPKNAWFFGMIFWFWNLILTDKDDKKIIYTWIKEHKYIARYLSRIIDYIKINWHTDDLSIYKTRKEREKEKIS